jgi:hypothetical protein
MGLYHLKKMSRMNAIEHLAKTRSPEFMKGTGMLYLGIAHKQKGNLGRASIICSRAIDKGIESWMRVFT